MMVNRCFTSEIFKEIERSAHLMINLLDSGQIFKSKACTLHTEPLKHSLCFAYKWSTCSDARLRLILFYRQTFI